MASLNETPRQKMINILYLVLLGLAATTITEKVIDAFHNLTVSMETTTKDMTATTEARLSAFMATNMKSDPVRSTPFWERANKVKAYCENLNKVVEDIKAELVKRGGGIKPNGEVGDRENIDITPAYMINEKHAKQLKASIMACRDSILAMMTAKEKENTSIPLDAKDPVKKDGVKTTWEEDAFGDGIPLTAAFTALAKIQMDIKNTENSTVRKVLSMANNTELTFDDYIAIAVPESKLVLQGQEYKAEVFLTAFSKTQNPKIVVNGRTLEVKDGKGTYTASTPSLGEQKYSGSITVTTTDGRQKEYKLEEQKYRVEKPTAVVSPTKMNVFYVGLDNPISISAGAMANDLLHPSITPAGEGEVVKVGTEYVVRVKHPNTKVTVNVAGELEKGKAIALGGSEFRVKKIPTPKVKFGGKSSGSMPAVAVKTVRGIFAKLEEFEFETQFNINHFKMLIIFPRGADPYIKESNGTTFTPDMMAALNKVGPGTKLLFMNVQATGPDNQPRPLDDIIISAE